MAYRAQRINVDEPPRRSPVADKQPEPKSPKSPARPAFSRHASASKVPIALETRPESVNQGKSIIDMDIFQQILELDDDDAHVYSRDLAGAYFAQARTTFDDMRRAFAKKDLKELSSLGHFLKGSSAALGVAKVESSCQKIEHYGKLRDEKENRDLTKDDALSRIGALLGTVGNECTIAEDWLDKWYQDERRH